MGPRLIIVSNRVAAPDPSGAPSAGGMAVAVKAALKNRKGLWFGWSGRVSEDPDPAPQVIDVKRVTYVLVDLSKNDVQEYYNGLANSVLWPILHYRGDMQEYTRADASGYLRVNRMFADKLSPLVGEEDIIWVHDYHLMLLGHELRARGHRNRIGFFLHTPCAPPDILQVLPLHEQIFGSLFHYDLVGFQTANDRDNFARYLIGRGANPIRGGAYEIEGRQVKLGVFGVSIETKTYMRLARNAGRSAMVALVKESLSDNKLVLGVDRLDYTKGIPDRIKAFERFLEDYPDWRGKVTFLQITPKSRSDVKEYGEIESEVTGLIGRVNGSFGDAAWTPIRYVNRSYSRTVLAGFYRAADVALVTPLTRRHEPRRKGIPGGAGSGESRRAGPVRVRGRRARARAGLDRQPARDRRGRVGAQARPRDAARRAARTARAHARASSGQRHHQMGGGLSLRARRGSPELAACSTASVSSSARSRGASRWRRCRPQISNSMPISITCSLGSLK